MNGWIALDRDVIQRLLALPPNTVKVALACQYLANWRDREWWDGRQLREIPVGSLWTSLASLAALTKLSVRNLRTALEHLETVGFLTSQATRHGRLISLTSYNTYDGAADATDKQPDKPPTNPRQTPDNPPTTPEQVKQREQGKQDLPRHPGVTGHSPGGANGKTAPGSLGAFLPGFESEGAPSPLPEPKTPGAAKPWANATKPSGIARDVCARWLEYLAEKAGKRHLKLTTARVRQVSRALRDGYTEAELRAVVWSKCLGPRKWLGDEKLGDFVTPETLLRPSNLAKYVEQAREELCRENPKRARELGWLEDA